MSSPQTKNTYADPRFGTHISGWAPLLKQKWNKPSSLLWLVYLSPMCKREASERTVSGLLANEKTTVL